MHVKINLNNIKDVAWPLGVTNISLFMSPKHTYMIQIEKGNTKSHTCMQTFHHHTQRFVRLPYHGATPTW